MLKEKISFITEQARNTCDPKVMDEENEERSVSFDSRAKTISAGGSGVKKARVLPTKMGNGGDIVSQSHPHFNGLLKKSEKKIVFKVRNFLELNFFRLSF